MENVLIVVCALLFNIALVLLGGFGTIYFVISDSPSVYAVVSIILSIGELLNLSILES